MHIVSVMFRPLGLSVLAILLLLLLPFAALVAIALGGDAGAWAHLARYVLPGALLDTALLLLLVSIGTTVLGAGTAWLTTLCRFPGRRFFGWALVLPLAVPTYVAAYAQVEFFDFSGPLQAAARNLLSLDPRASIPLFDIRNVWGAGLIFSLVLYPYVFLSTRLALSMQGASAIELSRSLGASPSRVLWRIAGPMARPAIAAGVALVLMETLNDIGAVEILGVRTLSFAVFETWLNRDSLGSAVQLSLLCLVAVLLLIVLERAARGARDYQTATRDKPPGLVELSALGRWSAVIACAVPILLGLGIPLLMLIVYALRRVDEWFSPAFFEALFNSVLVASITALVATAIAYFLVQTARLSPRGLPVGWAGRLATLGYAVPGTVLAIGLLIPLAAFDNIVDGAMRQYFGVSSGLLISGTVLILVYACTIRFLAIAYATMEGAFARLSVNIDLASRSLGRTALQTALQVHRPALHRAFAVSALLVFVDTMKELSATLVLRPFGVETLATFVYGRASQAAFEDAAFAAIVIVLVGLLPVIAVSGLMNVARQPAAVAA